MTAPHSTTAAQQKELSQTLKVPQFHWLAEKMRAGGRWVIQDLGAANAATIDYLNQFRCRLEIADLPASLSSLLSSEADDDESLGNKVQQALPARTDEPVDIILCWDLLNYLDRRTLTAVMARLAQRANQCTWVHSLIVYSAARMPVVPSLYMPNEQDDLITTPVTTELRDAPRHTPDDLARCMPDYRVERAVLLNNGMQEFLFRI